MNLNLLLTADTGAAGSDWTIWIMMGVMVVMMFFMSRSSKKREKQAAEMRNSVQVGDGVTTIGGIVGRVVSIKDDTVLLETGSDRNKLRIMKWAIQDVEKLDLGGAKPEEKKASKKEKAEDAE
ncbi:MAG: preprotein translocase subunit YajC [Oscillospiraceae bacterium]|nr:preprotein translocase subunit YajC [Oscillospiraceae bacterium]